MVVYPELPPEMEPPRVGWAWSRRRGWFRYDHRVTIISAPPITTRTVNSAYEDWFC